MGYIKVWSEFKNGDYSLFIMKLNKFGLKSFWSEYEKLWEMGEGISKGVVVEFFKDYKGLFDLVARKNKFKQSHDAKYHLSKMKKIVMTNEKIDRFYHDIRKLGILQSQEWIDSFKSMMTSNAKSRTRTDEYIRATYKYLLEYFKIDDQPIDQSILANNSSEKKYYVPSFDAVIRQTHKLWKHNDACKRIILRYKTYEKKWKFDKSKFMTSEMFEERHRELNAIIHKDDMKIVQQTNDSLVKKIIAESEKSLETITVEWEKEYYKYWAPKINSKRMLPLNEEQMKFVLDQNLRCGVIAGAGSGKTASLIEKFKHLVEDHGVNPNSIHVVAFNKKVKEEIMLKLKDQGIVTNTVHTYDSLALSVLNSLATPDGNDIKKLYHPLEEWEFNKLLEKAIMELPEVYKEAFIDFRMNYMHDTHTFEEDEEYNKLKKSMHEPVGKSSNIDVINKKT